jgi:WXG100 family type VII secretion target
MSDEIRADYDQLEQVAHRFASQSQSVQDTLQRVRGSMETLRGGWMGRGSDAFFSEMESEVLPATQRLQEALDTANQVTRMIVQIMQQADEEASQPFTSSR